jgi:hypothetical protein
LKVFVFAGVVLGIALIGAAVLYLYRIGDPVNPNLSNDYYHHAWKKIIVFSPMGNWFELGYHETDADPLTFQVIEREFGKDKNAVYWQGRKQTADVHTFRLEDGIPKDAQHVYFDAKDYTWQLSIVAGADPTTYQRYPLPIKGDYTNWGVDKNSFFLEGQRVAVDRATFRILNRTLAVDTAAVYAILRPTETMRVEIKSHRRPAGTATVLNELYAQIGQTLVHSSWRTPYSEIAFEAIRDLQWLNAENVIVNGKHFVQLGESVANVDVASVEIIDHDFMKDQQRVFFRAKEIPGADPATFTIVFEYYSRDKNFVYFQNQKLEGAVPSTFVYQFNTGLGTDGTRYYRDGVPVEDVK